jgi:carnitine O-acetyltransferase
MVLTTSWSSSAAVSKKAFFSLLSRRAASSRHHHHYRPAAVLTTTTPTSTMTFPSYQNKSPRFSTTATTKATTVVVVKPWENRKFLTNGDYTEDSWVEDPTAPLYRHQSTLPRLPVPTIADTCARLLPTALPLAVSEDESEQLQRAVAVFPAQAAHLHERLLQRANDWNQNKNSSWLQLWWNQMGYLDVRDSVVINVSYYFAFIDDPTATTYIQRAASMLTAVGHFRQAIVSQQRPADTIGKGMPLCSTAYKYMFHACRVPQKDRDVVAVYDPARYTHAVVVARGQFFPIPFLDPVTHEPLPLAALEAVLHDCVQQAVTAAASADDNNGMDQLGVCTSMNRDDWAAARAVLCQNGPVAAALEQLESGAVLLCLDIDESPVSKSQLAKLLLHGPNGHNRWYDKSIQLIVTKNGKAGLMGEHAMMDGMPVVQLADAITKLKYGDIVKKEDMTAATTSATATTATAATRIFPQPFPLTLSSLLQPHISKAQRDFDQLTTTNELAVCRFDGYGSSFMKQAGYSPDAYAQMIMQIATYRLLGGGTSPVGTYESTQVRPFLHGRTETTRTVSPESAQLCQLFGPKPLGDEDDPESRGRKLLALDAACRSHVNYLKMAGNGLGVDRHLFGLSCLVAPNETLPDLYRDPVYQRAKRWRVSTSHLTHPNFDSWGYGPVVSDGVGLAYSIHPRHCVFTITAHRDHGGWPDQLSTLLQEALVEVQTTIEMDQLLAATKEGHGRGVPQSRL